MADCDDCDFTYDLVELSEIGPRIRAGVIGVASALESVTGPTRRPAPDRWSANEYAAHVRDVLITMRDRLVIGLVEDNPGFKPLYKDERLELGLYRADTVGELSDEVRTVGPMMVRLFDAIPVDQLSRMVRYGFPDPSPQTLLWMGRQAVHETEHHLKDIIENGRLLAG